MVYIILVLALLMVILFLWITRSETPRYDTEPRFVVYDSTGDERPPEPGPIPKIVWSYWHSEIKPLVVEQCVRNWMTLNPAFAVNLVDSGNLFDFVRKEELPQTFHHLGGVRQSEWLRLYLLRRYGGIWLDASIVLTRPLDWLLEAQAASRAHYLGFYLDRYTVRADCPIIDSWSMAAPAKSRFIEDWFAEFSGKALTESMAYIEALGDAAFRAHILQKIPSPGYLAVHVAAQVLLHRQKGYRLHLIRAEDSAYFFQTRARRWKRAGFFAFMLLYRSGAALPALIKMRGGERRKLEIYLRWRLFRKNSIAGRFLDNPPQRSAARAAQ